MTARHDIQSRLLELDRLDREVIQAVATGQVDDLGERLGRFVELKKAIQIDLIASSAEQVHDARARMLLQRLSSGEAFRSDHVLAAFEARAEEDIKFDDLDDHEAQALASDLFYSWTCGEDYVQSLYRLGVVALAMRVPGFLRAFLGEARSCFALKQYLATVALCRSAVEASLRDIGLRKGILRADSSNVLLLDDQQAGVGRLIARLAQGGARERLRNLYAEASDLVHGRRALRTGEARQIYDRTIEAINELYNSHRM